MQAAPDHFLFGLLKPIDIVGGARRFFNDFAYGTRLGRFEGEAVAD